MNKDSLIALSVVFLVLAFLWMESSREPAETPLESLHAVQMSVSYGTPVLDGNATDAAWSKTEWLPLDQSWIGNPPLAADFSGKYKLLWDENNLYVLAEITDDTLMDGHEDGLLKYWDDDCLEIFVDEDASGGIHQFSYNAFAYHIALDGKVVDIRPDSVPAYFDDHCTTRRITNGKISTWEVAVKIFDGNQYSDQPGEENISKMLRKGKKMGFALAYCDNDRSPERENFMGSVPVEGPDKNRGWIDAGIFGLLTLD